jgi:transposase-like protein
MKTIEQKKTIRYSIGFKQMIVKEVEEGSSMEFVRKKYDIGGGATIQKWIRCFGKHHLLNKIIRVETMNEKDRLKQLEQDNKKLKLALADAYMAKECLEGVIRMADEEYKTDLKKNFGNRLPSNSPRNIK